jgi:hypothetical protein
MLLRIETFTLKTVIEHDPTVDRQYSCTVSQYCVHSTENFSSIYAHEMQVGMLKAIGHVFVDY